ncbi:MAG: glycosyltransferase family 2 protein [Candidatus Spechtbacterales bacterium]|nr:glycosyltransferase family 2 protein [Candidatus Spechtbacterales bacterium]
MKPLVYIVMLNWNGIEETLESLESLRSLRYPNYEVVLVDNGSDNNEGDKIKEVYPEIHLIKNDKNLGFAEGCNIGMRHAIGKGADYILLLNNDTSVDPDFIDILADFSENNKKTAVVSPKIYYYDSDKIWFNGAKLHIWAGLFKHIDNGRTDKEAQVKQPTSVETASGCAFFIRTSALKDIGLLYSPYFAYYEEADWSFRARRAGYDVMVVPESKIWHKVSAATGKKGENTLSPFQAYFFGRNPRIFAERNLSGLKKLLFVLAYYTSSLIYNISRCQSNDAIKKYFKGMRDGRNILKNKKWQIKKEITK